MIEQAWDADDNSTRSFYAGIKAIREREIRRGQVKPRPGDAEETQWAAEGYDGWPPMLVAPWW